MNTIQNIILLTDSYKVSHWKQYPPKTEYVQSYLESRGGLFSSTTFFGLQYIIKKYLVDLTVTVKDIKKANDFWQKHFGRDIFNKEAWLDIATRLHGKLPISIKAVKEGSSIPSHNVLMLIENTDPQHFWLTNYLETLLLQVWYPSTVATLSREIKKVLHAGLLKSADDTTRLPFMLHDFGFRGASSLESASIGGASHLVNFMGTDTAPACMLTYDYYHDEMSGFSIPATEHSTITAWGKEAELEAYQNLLNAYPAGTIACVSDSYDIFYACKHLWGDALKHQLENRDGTLVIRPDSGDPVNTVIQVIDVLGEAFGYTTNSKGYKVLPPYIRLIQGDGVNYTSIKNIVDALLAHQWSIENIAFGMGGALLQKLNRDTQQFALKCCSVTVDGIQRDVFKDPITDHAKKSKAGRLKLIQENGIYKTVREEEPGIDELIEVYRDGELLVDLTFQEVRTTAAL